MITIPKLYVRVTLNHKQQEVKIESTPALPNGCWAQVNDGVGLCTNIEEWHSCVAQNATRIIRLCPDRFYSEAELKYLWLYAMDVTSCFDDSSKPLMIPCGLAGSAEYDWGTRMLCHVRGVAYKGALAKECIALTYFTDPSFVVRGAVAAWQKDFEHADVTPVQKKRHVSNDCLILDCDRAVFSA